jgi:hypothetical protein
MTTYLENAVYQAKNLLYFLSLLKGRSVEARDFQPKGCGLHLTLKIPPDLLIASHQTCLFVSTATYRSLNAYCVILVRSFQLLLPGVSMHVTMREHPTAEGGTVGEKFHKNTYIHFQ